MYFCANNKLKQMKQTYSISPLCATLRNLIGGGKTLNISVLRNSFRSFSHAIPSFFIFLFGICLFSFSLFSCEKELNADGGSYPELQTYYTESCSWDAQVLTSDSLRRFRLKVADYVSVHPDAIHTSVYPKIQDNIRQASLRVTLTIDPTWGGDTVINF